jgi:hypothetical protein
MGNMNNSPKLKNTICDTRSCQERVFPLFPCVPHRFNCNITTRPAVLLARRLPPGFQNNQASWKTCKLSQYAKFMLWARLVETPRRVIVTLLRHVWSPSGYFLSLFGVRQFHLIDGASCTHYIGDTRIKLMSSKERTTPLCCFYRYCLALSLLILSMFMPCYIVCHVRHALFRITDLYVCYPRRSVCLMPSLNSRSQDIFGFLTIQLHCFHCSSWIGSP